MTIEQLLEISIEELEAMTDIQLTEKLSHYFIITRPEMISKSPKQNLFPSGNYEHKMKLARAKALAAQVGIELD